MTNGQDVPVRMRRTDSAPLTLRDGAGEAGAPAAPQWSRLMKRLGLSVLAGCFVFVVRVGATTPEHPVAASELARIGYYEYWELQLDLSRGGLATAVYLVDDTVYVMTGRGDVHAIHARAGLSRWSQNLTDQVDRMYAPTHFVDENDRDLGVFTTGSRTLILDRFAGDVVVHLPLRLSAGGSAVGFGSSIYLGSQDGHVYAMLWDDPRAPTGVFRWKVMAGGPVTATPVLINDGDELLFASQGGSVFCCTTAAKILSWPQPFKAGGPILGNICVDDAATYLSSTDRSVYRIDTFSGVKRWRARFPDPLYTGPVVFGGLVYQYSRDAGFTAIDAETGKIVWQNSRGRDFLCRGDKHVYVSDVGQGLLKIDVETGTAVAGIEVREGTLAVCNLVDDTIYLISDRGRMICAKPTGTPPLNPADITRAHRELRRSSRLTQTEEETPAAVVPHREQDVIDRNDPLRSKSDLPPVGTGD